VKFGVYHLIWAPPLNDENLAALGPKARALGADVLEIAVAREPLPFDPRRARRALADAGLETTLVTTLSAERDISSDDPGVHSAGTEFLKKYIDHAAELGSAILSGPLYGAVWNPTLLSSEERTRRWARSVETWKALAPFAAARGVKIALEPLTRFHTSFLNTAADARRLVDDIDHPAVGILLDTFQMGTEEKDMAAAIRTAGPRLFHLHASENDRGTPGTGLVDWPGIRDALGAIGYSGRMVIEAFNPDVPELASFLKVWRRLEKDQDTIAREGLRFLRELMA
jgi:D-psicose/D-tagatose/L-ribulose 3-epimerase